MKESTVQLNGAREQTKEPIVLSVQEACLTLRISKWALYRLIRSRQLETIRIGRRRLIPVTAIHQVRKVFSAALTYAVRLELLTRNVARLVELPSYRANEAKHWTSEEVQQFLGAARSDPLYHVFVLLVLYGLRSGEVRGLRWCDVDFVQGVLRIRQQIQRISGALQQVPLKTVASRRDEPLLTTARVALRQQQSTQAALRNEAATTWHGAGGHLPAHRPRKQTVCLREGGRILARQRAGRQSA
jgi:excisionase family DNA binding protein